MHTTLTNILKAPSVNGMDLTFSTSYDNYGHEQIVEFKEGGQAIQVTDDNRKEFVELYVNWFLNKSVETQFRPFEKGFYKVISVESIKVVPY